MSPKIIGESLLLEEFSVSWVENSDIGEFCDTFGSGLPNKVNDWEC